MNHRNHRNKPNHDAPWDIPALRVCYIGEAFFLFKHKTAYEISECDWSSDVCSSDLKQKTAYEISELQSHSEISYAVFCLKTKKHTSEHQSPLNISYAVLCSTQNN